MKTKVPKTKIVITAVTTQRLDVGVPASQCVRCTRWAAAELAGTECQQVYKGKRCRGLMV